VNAGLGVSVLPGGCLQRDPVYDRLDRRSFAEGGCYRRVVVCHSEEASVSQASEKVISVVEQSARALVERAGWLGAWIERPNLQ
jgi:LysR family transcriptional regulator, nitrogen assimilation regulatory protein